MSDPAPPDVTQLLNAISTGDRRAAADLLPVVYQELRQLARQRLAREAPGQTLQATALVHEAYLRLVGPADEKRWDGRGHFFAAAAEAMRCGGSWLRGTAGRTPKSAAAGPTARRWAGWPTRTRLRRNWSSSGTSPG